MIELLNEIDFGHMSGPDLTMAYKINEIVNKVNELERTDDDKVIAFKQPKN